MNTLVFDIETVPDTELGRRLHGLDGLGDEEVAKAMFARQREKTGSDFLPLHLHKVVAVAVALLETDQRFRVWSLGAPDADEAELVGRFFDGVERYRPVLVSWNGGGFDLPVLHYRALRHGIAARRYWDVGDFDRDWRWNNYFNRFHWRHTDLMDVLSGYQPRAAAPLDEIAAMLGLPGKMGMDGASVWDAYREGRIEAIRDYCEIDVLNTCLVYLRWEVTRGRLDPSAFDAECASIRDYLRDQDKPHLAAFVDAWSGA